MIPRHRAEWTLRDLLATGVDRRELSIADLAERHRRAGGFWCPSGRAALAWTLQALGARVAIVPAWNCWAVMEALERARVEPWFVDLGTDLNADPEALRSAFRRAPPGTVWILTHQFGIPQPGTRALVHEARQGGLVVLEDGAAAWGAKSDAGEVGAVGCGTVLSLQYTKTVVAGDGGILLAGPELAAAVRDREAGWVEASLWGRVRSWLALLLLRTLTAPAVYGPVWRLALARVGTRNVRDRPAPERLFRELPGPFSRRLARISHATHEQRLAARRRMARGYLEGLAGLPVETFPAVADEEAAPIRFPVLVADRERLVAAAARRGLDLGRSFSYTCSPAGFPRAERVASRIVNLPLSSELEPWIPEVLERFRGALRDAS